MPKILVSSRRGLRPAALALAALLMQGAAAGQEAAPPYRDPGLPVEQRVRDLLGRMTLEEKAAQLAMSGASMDVVDLTGKYTSESARLALSEMSTPQSKVSVREGAVLRNAVQRYLMTKTRLGIPALFQGELLHGFEVMVGPNSASTSTVALEVVSRY